MLSTCPENRVLHVHVTCGTDTQAMSVIIETVIRDISNPDLQHFPIRMSHKVQKSISAGIKTIFTARRTPTFMWTGSIANSATPYVFLSALPL